MSSPDTYTCPVRLGSIRAVPEDKTMTLDEARQLSAQAWCQPETSRKIMDAALCEAFARILLLTVNQKETS